MGGVYWEYTGFAVIISGSLKTWLRPLAYLLAYLLYWPTSWLILTFVAISRNFGKSPNAPKRSQTLPNAPKHPTNVPKRSQTLLSSPNKFSSIQIFHNSPYHLNDF